MSSKRAPPPTRAEQKERTRASLLAAARRCFDARGFDATVVADIVREAKVAHGTFYVHFESRESIADALLADVNVELATRFAPVLAGAAQVSREETVRALVRTFLALLDEDRALVRWYAERASAGLPTRALAEGVNPPVVAALAPALLSQSHLASAADLDLAMHGLLALWLRVGLRYALVEATSRAAAERVLVAITTAALDALLGEAPGEPRAAREPPKPTSSRAKPPAKERSHGRH